MYLLIKVLLNTFNIVWAGIPGFVLAVNEFLTKTGEIDGAVQVQEKKIRPSDTFQRRREMEDKFLRRGEGKLLVCNHQFFSSDGFIIHHERIKINA